MSVAFVDYYELLEVDPRASTAEIKAAYRARIVRDHVDQNPDDPQAQERTMQLTQAKQVLLDEQRRRAFDQQRAWVLATRRFGVEPTPGPASGSPGHHHIEVDLRDVSLGKLLVGAGAALLIGGLMAAAKAVADRQGRGRRR